jgi:hypothetical protein
MRVVARVAVLGFAGLTALGAAGCNRGGGSGGTTTIIQQPGGGSLPPSSSSAAPASVAPIDDPKELCHQVLQKSRGLSNAVIAFWHIATNPGEWSYTDPVTSEAVSRVEKESGQVFPALNSIVGKGAPTETKDAVLDYLKTIKEFSDVIVEQQKNDALNPAASSFGHAKDKLENVCSVAG